MKKDTNKTILVLALISIVLCGCPGCFLLAPGMTAFLGEINDIQSIEGFLTGIANGIIQGGWMVCSGGLLILLPLTLLIIRFLLKDKNGKLEDIEPTGISQDDPIPPTS